MSTRRIGQVVAEMREVAGGRFCHTASSFRDVISAWARHLDTATSENADLLAALVAVQSQCAGHSDEFSGRVWQIADAAIKKVKGQ